MEVTKESLASALERFHVRVTLEPGSSGSYVVTDADETAEALWATLCRMEALRNPATEEGLMAGLSAECATGLHSPVCGGCGCECHDEDDEDRNERNRVRREGH
jgi:hypothetical protein